MATKKKNGAAPVVRPSATMNLEQEDCSYLVLCVTEKGAPKKRWAGFERIPQAEKGVAKFARLTLTFYTAADACDALHQYLKGKKL